MTIAVLPWLQIFLILFWKGLEDVSDDKQADIDAFNTTLIFGWFFKFKAQFIKKYPRYKKIGYNSSVLQQTACLVVNPITVGNYAFLFNCIHCSTHIRQYQFSFSGESDASTCLSLVQVSFSLVRRCCFCYFRSFWWFVFVQFLCRGRWQNLNVVTLKCNF